MKNDAEQKLDIQDAKAFLYQKINALEGFLPLIGSIAMVIEDQEVEGYSVTLILGPETLKMPLQVRNKNIYQASQEVAEQARLVLQGLSANLGSEATLAMNDSVTDPKTLH